MLRLGTQFLSFLLVLGLLQRSFAAEQIEFPSSDDLTITADVYWSDKDNKQIPFICLFHQAGWSRGEYQEIAPRLVEMGFNCMAVDARSGRRVNGVENETAKRAKAAGRDVGNDYERALPDIVAALQYARDNFAEGQLIGWGSSYSASLIFKASSENEGLIDGSLSFAPNDMSPWTRSWIVEAHEKISHPVFITSARKEKSRWERLAESFGESQLTQFIPRTQGNHGSRALWSKFRDSEDYWEEVEGFLMANFDPATAAANATNGQVPGATSRPVANRGRGEGEAARRQQEQREPGGAEAEMRRRSARPPVAERTAETPAKPAEAKQPVSAEAARLKRDKPVNPEAARLKRKQAEKEDDDK